MNFYYFLLKFRVFKINGNLLFCTTSIYVNKVLVERRWLVQSRCIIFEIVASKFRPDVHQVLRFQVAMQEVDHQRWQDRFKEAPSRRTIARTPPQGGSIVSNSRSSSSHSYSNSQGYPWDPYEARMSTGQGPARHKTVAITRTILGSASRTVNCTSRTQTLVSYMCTLSFN